MARQSQVCALHIACGYSPYALLEASRLLLCLLAADWPDALAVQRRSWPAAGQKPRNPAGWRKARPMEPTGPSPELQKAPSTLLQRKLTALSGSEPAHSYSCA